MKHEDIPVDKIKLGHRYRADRGDIEALATNIRELGLLQPIGVDRFYQLIFGARRLEACKDILHWNQIPAVVLDINSVLAGEYAENEFRKQFTTTERTAIGRAIEEELGNRKGQRTDIEPRENFPEVERGRTEEIAARKAGFGNYKTYERAKSVVDRGTPELIAAMDKGDIKIDAAAKIATQPKPEQQRIVAMPKDEQREIVKQIRKTKADKEADERRAYDLRVFRGLAEAVEHVAQFHEESRSTWEGLSRVSAYRFSEHLDRAITCLVRLQKEHPNATRKPGIVAKAT
jgi:hypothetical protein